MYTSIFISLLIALLFAIILAFVFRRSGPGSKNGLLFIFLIIFIFSWAIGGWIEPIHPLHIRYPWLSYFFIGLFIMLLLGAIIPPKPSRNRIISKSDLDDKVEAEHAMRLTIGLFFWIMFILLIIVGITRWL